MGDREKGGGDERGREGRTIGKEDGGGGDRGREGRERRRKGGTTMQQEADRIELRTRPHTVSRIRYRPVTCVCTTTRRCGPRASPAVPLSDRKHVALLSLCFMPVTGFRRPQTASGTATPAEVEARSTNCKPWALESGPFPFHVYCQLLAQAPQRRPLCFAASASVFLSPQPAQPMRCLSSSRCVSSGRAGSHQQGPSCHAKLI